MFILTSLRRIPMQDENGRVREYVTADEAFAALGVDIGLVIDTEDNTIMQRPPTSQVSPDTFELGEESPTVRELP